MQDVTPGTYTLQCIFRNEFFNRALRFQLNYSPARPDSSAKPDNGALLSVSEHIAVSGGSHSQQLFGEPCTILAFENINVAFLSDLLLRMSNTDSTWKAGLAFLRFRLVKASA